MSGVLLVLGTAGAAGRPAWAEDGTAQTVAAAPAVADAASEGADKKNVEKTRSAAKPARPLTIVADEAEAGRLAAITDVVHGWPIKVVPPTSEEGAVFVVKTGLQPAPKVPGAREVKLFTEHLHVVAGRGISSMEDLRGRPVSFGPNGGRSQEAARRAFRALGIAVSELPLDLDNALDGVATGDVAAVVLLAPAPVPRLKAVSQSGLHLLAWPDGGALPSGGVATTLAGDVYPNLGGAAVPALGAESVLALTPHGATLPAAKRFLEAVAQHAPALSKRGLDLLSASRARPDDRHLASAERR